VVRLVKEKNQSNTIIALTKPTNEKNKGMHTYATFVFFPNFSKLSPTEKAKKSRGTEKSNMLSPNVWIVDMAFLLSNFEVLSVRTSLQKK
jgi:hypothetical protein